MCPAATQAADLNLAGAVLSCVCVCNTVFVFSVLSAKFTVVSLTIHLALSKIPSSLSLPGSTGSPPSPSVFTRQLATTDDVDDQMVTEQVVSTTILARIENDVGIKREKDRDHSNRFDIVDVEERETVLEMEEVDKKHISASVMKKTYGGWSVRDFLHCQLDPWHERALQRAQFIRDVQERQP